MRRRYETGVGTGRNQKGLAQLAKISDTVFVCTECGCLSWLHAAMRHAPEERGKFEPGSGCASRACVRPHGTFQPGRYMPRQMGALDRILSGERCIIAQPRTYDDGKRMWLGQTDALHACLFVIERLCETL